MKFTDAQETAINTSGKNILVSAAAGSGKTTVLCERIKRGIIRGDYELPEIIVVSFNTESAADIRAKLLKSLTQAYSESGSIKLFRQIMSLDRAQISTIHSFALKLIKENSERLGLPAKTRNIDENEGELLKNEIMNRVISKAYGEIEGFVELSDHITSDRDGDFASIFLKLYDKLMNEPLGVELIRKRAQGISELSYDNFKNSVWGKMLLEKRTEALRYYKQALEEAASSYAPGSKGEQVYGARFKAMADFASELLEAEDEEEFGRIIRDTELPNFKGARAAEHKGELYDHYKAVFDEFKDAIEKKRSVAVEYTKENFESDVKKSVMLSSVVYKLLHEFDLEYSEEKKKRGLIDYTDMERMAHRLLVDENGEKTDIAKRYTKKFKAVYVDEYQDTNRVQDEIFRAISHNNLFIVGDIKQSIYGFRGGAPDIFSEYRKNGFAEGGEKIFLSDNFRSDEMVIRFSNSIFSRLMRADSSVGYVCEDDLKHSKKPKDNKPPKREKVELHFFENRKKVFDEATGEEIERPYSDEAEYIASRIKSEIEKGEYKSKDIAILVRSGGDKLAELLDALRDYNVPVSTNEKEDYYKKPHVLMLMCLLNLIDNPERDIYTAGALHSDVFGFTTDELVSLKGKASGESLWSAVCESANDGEISPRLLEKIVKVRSFYEEYKALEKKTGADEVTRRIINDLGIADRYSAGKGASQAAAIRGDIHKIYSEAKVCTERYGMGLSGFVGHIERLSRIGKSEKSTKGDEDSVKILTIHGSKGLEFKMCFLYNTDKGMNVERDDVGNFKKSPFEYESEFGVALPVYDDEGRCVHDTSIYRAIRAKRQRSVKEEELRLLYVAMTRAEEKLIITGKCTQKKLDGALGRPVDRKLSVHEVFSSRSFLDWILLCFGAIPQDTYTLSFDSEPPHEQKDSEDVQVNSEKISESEIKRLELVKKEYGYRDVLGIPAKLTVSKLYPSVLDDGTLGEELDGAMYDFALPDFMNEGRDARAGARRGTATHLFMQFCDLSNVSQQGVESEITRLCDRGFISKQVADDVDRDQIGKFISSKLCKRILLARRVYKEQRFNVKLPASEFTENEERKEALSKTEIFVQGVIDLVFEREDSSLVLVDYKTDSFPKNYSKEQIAQALKKRYALQLEYYKKAVKIMFGREPEEVLIYSFALSDTVSL